MSASSNRLVEILHSKYSQDPKAFREFLPGAAELLPDRPPPKSRPVSPFGLTERERSYHAQGLEEVSRKMHDDSLTVGEALKGLQHCADLIKDDVFTNEVTYEMLKALTKAATGKSPGSYKVKTAVPVCEGGPVAEQISVIVGVYLDLDVNGCLVSISINPQEVRKRRDMMKIVGIGRDSQPDVAMRHDDYLAMQDPHGRF